MDGIAEWLARITWPLVSRALSALGVGTVTYVGADSAVNAALDAAKAGFVGMTSDILQLLAMAGFFDAMSIMSGGIVSGLAWMVMKRFALQTTGA
ncbi:DUF2523 domain-containing protein [Rhodoferax ferrireducens]|uniref:DUF2523 domain-containing protein n=1 Tax=Rhodoferax ferrireducens TaxID=192843 RepID=UPI000E0D77F6|nr:DUF2523 domain-containing protein [Rhodoferax ferrireducens]